MNMNRHEMEQALIQMSHTNGFYGRLLHNLSCLPDHIREEFWLNMEARGAKDIVDLLMILERD